MKNLLYKISLWLYEKTCPIPRSLQYKFSAKVGNKEFTVHSMITNNQLSLDKFPFFIDLEYQLTELVDKICLQSGKIKAEDLFSGKEIIKTEIIPDGEIWVGIGKHNMGFNGFLPYKKDILK